MPIISSDPTRFIREFLAAMRTFGCAAKEGDAILPKSFFEFLAEDLNTRGQNNVTRVVPASCIWSLDNRMVIHMPSFGL